METRVPRWISIPDDGLGDVRYVAVRGTVLSEHVYGQRTGRYTSVALREMWVRGEDGAERRLVANAHCAAVRAGHRVEALVAERGAQTFVLRLRNLDTGDDRILLTSILQLGGEAGPAAMLVALASVPVILFAGLVLGLTATAMGWALSERFLTVLLLTLPFVAALATAAVLAPVMRRRRARLRQAADAFTSMADDAAA